MDPQTGQALFEQVISLILTAYGIGLTGGVVIWLMKQAGKSY